jgi:DUF4097 and DUF4098 domain-containing protein YvlB
MNLLARVKLALPALLLPLAAAAQDGTFDRTLPVGAAVRLEVQTGSGSIRITPGPPGNVRIHGEIRLSFGALGGKERVRRIEENPPVVQEGSVVRVGRTAAEDEDLLRDVSISYELTVPPDASVESSTGSGSQTIGDLSGPVAARSGSGSLAIGAIGGSVTAHAGSGSIRIASARGLDAKTGSGSITARGIAGAIRASAGSGGIELEQTAPGDVVVETGSGTVDVSGAKGALRVATGSGSIRAQGELAGDWRLEAASGSVEVELPSDAGFELTARTHSGHIDTEIPVSVTGTISRKELTGTVRGGGHRLEIDTSSGAIRIR